MHNYREIGGWKIFQEKEQEQKQEGLNQCPLALKEGMREQSLCQAFVFKSLLDLPKPQSQK